MQCLPPTQGAMTVLTMTVFVFAVLWFCSGGIFVLTVLVLLLTMLSSCLGVFFSKFGVCFPSVA